MNKFIKLNWLDVYLPSLYEKPSQHIIEQFNKNERTISINISHIISYYESYVIDKDENYHYFTNIKTTNNIYYVKESPYRIGVLIKTPERKVTSDRKSK